MTLLFKNHVKIQVFSRVTCHNLGWEIAPHRAPWGVFTWDAFYWIRSIGVGAPAGQIVRPEVVVPSVLAVEHVVEVLHRLLEEKDWHQDLHDERAKRNEPALPQDAPDKG